ncbi:hypothetical protein [uncultured Arcticibacterium sp.]|uniref:hypothetical protein n=1 Tax=uncultured Arcticibacterium sp. TaxID=2173042 RepID=UPI0030FADD0C
MKNLKFYLPVILFSLLLVSCSKEDKEPDPLVKEDIEESPHYQINLSIETDNYDNPDEKETLNYTFEFQDGAFSEKVRKVNDNLTSVVNIKNVAGTPVRIVGKASLEFNYLSELPSNLGNPTFGVDVIPGVSGSSSPLFARGIDDEPTQSLSNVPIIQVEGAPDRFTQNLLILGQVPNIEVLKAAHEVKLEINDGNKSIGTIVIPFEIDTELATFDLRATRKATQNQASESITYEGINEGNWPSLDYKYKHVVGGDGCPMPLWDFSINMTNNVSSETKNMFSYGITGLNNVDALAISYPEGPGPETVEYMGQNYPFFPPNNSGNFQAEFKFNCIRAQNVNAENATLTIMYSDGMTGHPIFDAPIPFSIEMQ